MRKPEQLLWDRIKRANDAVHGPLLLERLENSVGSGRPDVDGLCNGRFWPIELKAIPISEIPARSGTPLLGKARGLNPQQMNWHKDWQDHGGKSIVAIGVGSHEIIAMGGRHGDLINSMPLGQLKLAALFVAGNAAEFVNYIIKESYR